ncbi:uncharacterized protein LOC125947099 [Dermacentor silvarum]|uniref:uncharacterized protein LOC125947099 n=1 Tax=Dermacentor silvarum TaxID=543639 RepID=UPI0021018DC2|nr:uncharacterized protein LOC125947099 [Dermacentor silvarum]
MDGTTVLLIEGAKERRNQRSEEGPSAEVRQPSQIQEESDLDARLRTAITVGVMTMVILGLLAMVYAFNEAQRQLEYLQDSDNVKPIECPPPRRSGSWDTRLVVTLVGVALLFFITLTAATFILKRSDANVDIADETSAPMKKRTIFL